mmetsp:Transcript_7157/g.10945  ORF Transcript_7157/g.10945 Transcript_7157/m.10945 type:complete len:201 (+) Transcript_7157:2235-2837(+)
MTKNSWKASLFPACSPPLITLKHGTGRVSGSSFPATSPKCFQRGTPFAAAPALLAARETIVSGLLIVSSKVRLVWCSICLEKCFVDSTLIGCVHSHYSSCQWSVDVGNSLEDTLAHVTGSTITQFDGFVRSGRSTTRDRGSKDTLGGGNVDFDGWITTRIDDFASLDSGNGGEGASLGGGRGKGATEYGVCEHCCSCSSY